jgi:hypothetical protein
VRAAVLRIPKGKGEGEVEPTPGGTSAAADDGAGTDDAEARDGGTVAPFASMLSCDMPASTHVGELWRAARRRSARACRERFPERLLRRAGVVGAMRLRSEERSCMR